MNLIVRQRIHFVLPGRPRTKGRPEWRSIKAATKAAPESPLTGPVRVEFRFILPPPTSLSRADKALAKSGVFIRDASGRGDVDNFAKFALDVLEAACFFCRADCQVAEIHASKWYHRTWRHTVVTIEELELFSEGSESWVS